jgi:NAD(P)H-quinone oxidoreductase subunit 5
MVLAIAVVLGLAAAVSILFGATLMREPGIFVLGAVVLLGLMHLIASAIDERPSLYVVVRAAGLAIAVAVGYFALQAAMQRLTDGALAPVQALRGPLELVIGATVILAFAALTLFQALLPSQQARPRWQALYVHVAAGFYLNTLANRAVLRLWPHIAPARGGRT